jgi:hypothetical protein
VAERRQPDGAATSAQAHAGPFAPSAAQLIEGLAKSWFPLAQRAFDAGKRLQGFGL